MSDHIRNGDTLTRRDAAKLIVMAFAGAAAPFGDADAADAALFKDNAEQLRAFMRLQSRIDNGFTHYLNTGTVYAALPGRQSVPLYGYEGLLRFHTRVIGPNTYDVTFIEAGTYLDHKTGERIDRLQNPITDVANTVEHIVEGPMTWRWTAENLTNPAPAPTVQRRVAWQHLEDQSCVHFDNMIAMDLPDGTHLNAAALATYVGRTAEIRDHKRTSVANTMLIDASINPWAPWLKMTDVPGRLVNNIVGRKLGAMSEASDRLLKFIDATHPRVLKGVEAWQAAG